MLARFRFGVPLVVGVSRAARLSPYRTGNSGKTEAEVEAPARRRAPEAVRRLAADGAVAPAAAPEHPARAQRGRSPLRHVAVHVAQAQLIRWVRANPRGSSEVLSLGRVAGRIIAVEVGLIGGEVVARLGV